MKSRTPSSQLFDTEQLYQILFEQHQLPANQSFTIAYSGGADSTALLLAMEEIIKSSQYPANGHLTAFHFNHKIDPMAEQWEQQCAALCKEIGVSLKSASWDRSASQSITESAARNARYKWFETEIKSDQVLLTGHHSDDQVETVLLNLVQGRGIARAGGIPAIRSLGHGDSRQVIRPLLNFPRSSLEQFVRHKQKPWIEDPANRDLQHDRNLIRHQIVPLLRQRWPQINQALTQYADDWVEHQQFLNQQLDDVLFRATDQSLQGICCLAAPLSIKPFHEMNRFCAEQLLRRWIHLAGYNSPRRVQLSSLVQQVMQLSNQDKESQSSEDCFQTEWNDLSIRYRNRYLYMIQQSSQVPDKPIPIDLESNEITRDLNVRFDKVSHTGLTRQSLVSGKAQWRWRTGGEKVNLPNAAHRFSLKKLFQQYDVLPWERNRLPYIEMGGQIAWIPGIGVTRDFADSDSNSDKVLPVLLLQKSD